MAQALSHLCTATRPEAMLDHGTRIRSLQRDRWIDYPRATEAIQRLERLLNAPERERMPCLAMHGDSNIGKTLIVSKLRRCWRWCKSASIRWRGRGFGEGSFSRVLARDEATMAP